LNKALRVILDRQVAEGGYIQNRIFGKQLFGYDVRAKCWPALWTWSR